MEAFDAKSEPLLLPEAFDLNVDPLPAIDFKTKSMEKINLALLEAGELDFEPVKKAVLAEGDLDEDPIMGVTAIGVTFDGGVVFGVDSKLQGTTANQIYKISDNLYLCCSGQVAHCKMFSNYVRFLLDKYTQRIERQATVRAAANLVSSVAYTNKEKFRVSFIGGWDTYEGGKIFWIPQGGSTVIDQAFAVEGPISEYLHGVLNTDWKKNMTQHEAQRLIVHLIYMAIHENAVNFSGTRTIVVGSEGTSQTIYSTIEQVADLDAANSLVNNSETISDATNTVNSGGVEKNKCLTFLEEAAHVTNKEGAAVIDSECILDKITVKSASTSGIVDMRPTLLEEAAFVTNKDGAADATMTAVVIDSECILDNINIPQRKSASASGIVDINKLTG